MHVYISICLYVYTYIYALYTHICISYIVLELDAVPRDPLVRVLLLHLGRRYLSSATK